MNVLAVESNPIKTIGYSFGRLIIRFNSGCSFEYALVPTHIWNGLVRAENKGNYFHHNIKGRFRYTKLTEDPFERRSAPSTVKAA